MPIAPTPGKACRAVRGSALIIVLFFVLLLSIATIAFLSRSLTAVKVSSSSAGETKSKILAASASDIIIGDFKQEIIAGSTNFAGGANPNSGTVAYPVYTPTANLTAIPLMNGVPTAGSPATNAIPNLISRSVSTNNTSGAAPYVAYPAAYYTGTLTPPVRAASDPSATTYTSSKVNSATPSLNGRYISPAQWNEHYLIPRNAPGSGTDSTPVSTFVPPDWVIVTRGGANSVAWSSGTGGLNDPTLSNNNFAVGRYAYAVYNEGGLLDMNAAGYPGDPSLTTTTTPPFYSGTPNGLTPIQSSEKMGLPLADLTQLTVGTASLTQAQINNIVGWRNYASTEPPAPGGTFGSFTFTQGNASNWLTNFVLGNTNGYMQVVPPASGVSTPPTDQVFLSRQQLIGVIQNLGINSDFLQNMGTFSRGLDQPSTVPDPNRPKILTVSTGVAGSPAPPAFGQADSYFGNSNAEGGDTDPTGINPSFLAIRATSGFTRWNGTTAIIGEPLVKTKFALSWLRMVAYNAINTSLPAGFAATSSDPDPIKDRFGLSRTSNSSPWVYSHGQNYIMTLTQVAAAGREPDFAELLKASIIAGSLAKGGPNIHNGQYNYQYVQDTNFDLAVIQIMANLIDQQDSDSYPTVISLNGTSVSGVEDLPYFYRFHLFSVVTRPPAPLVPMASSVSFPPSTSFNVSTTMATTYPAGTVTTASWTASTGTSGATYSGCEAGTLSDQGEAALLYIPELWNPHDPNTVSTTSLRPQKFRICASTTDPAGSGSLWTVGAESKMNGSGIGSGAIFQENDNANPPATYYWPVSGGGMTSPTTPPTTWPLPSGTPNANATLTFWDNGGTLFREPTLLWNNNPAGMSLAGPSATDTNTSQKYYGFDFGHTPVSTQVTVTPAGSTATTYICQGNALAPTELQPVGTYAQYTISLQYQDPNNSANWITYDVKYPEVQHSGMQNPTLVVNTSDFPNGSWQNPMLNAQFTGAATVMDPRSARWGVGSAATLGNAGVAANGQLASSGVPYVLEPYVNANFYNYANMKSTYFSVLESNRPRADAGNLTYYSNPCMTSDPNGTAPPTTSGFKNLQMRWFAQGEYREGSGYKPSPGDFDGLFSQNNPAVSSTTLAQNGTTSDQVYNEDPDAVARPAMGAYAGTSLSGSTVGLPEVTASTFNNSATGTATSQSQSRPLVLNRPFRSVAEMSYAFSGSPWKNIDFFHPSSGDSALLDTFCLNEPPANAMVAGKVDLNTRNIPVLQAVVAGAYVDEINNAAASPPSYALPPLTGTEANKIATTLEEITADTAHAWRGPLKNISALVGRFVSNPGTTSDTDLYTYSPPALSSGGSLPTVNYAGLSSALDCSSFFGAPNHVYANSSTPLVQRFREAAIRPLAAAGQVRVWNLLIDIVAQSGHYPKTATGLDQFVVEGQSHLWVHVAIDRYTGQVIDKQIETVTP
jgi:hypothetical protein